MIVGRRMESSTCIDLEETITYLQDSSLPDEINAFAEALVEGTAIYSGAVEETSATMTLIYNIYYSDPDWKQKYNLLLLIKE